MYGVSYGHLGEVSLKDTRDIVGSEVGSFVFPIEIIAILHLDVWYVRKIIS